MIVSIIYIGGKKKLLFFRALSLLLPETLTSFFDTTKLLPSDELHHIGHSSAANNTSEVIRVELLSNSNMQC